MHAEEFRHSHRTIRIVARLVLQVRDIVILYPYILKGPHSYTLTTNRAHESLY